MTLQIKIVGTGISGLFTAYHLQKLIPQGSDAVKIEIFDNQLPSTDNASTISLAWLNSAYPCSDPYDANAYAYDQFRIEALKAWTVLNEVLIKNGISDILASQETSVEVDGDSVNSMYVFFDDKERNEFLEMLARLRVFLDNYQAHVIPRDKIEQHFPFLAKIANYSLYNVAQEQLVNPNQLRTQLISYLQTSGVTFHWNTLVSAEKMQAEPNTQWILAAGNGCLNLVKDTKLDGVPFVKESIAEVVYCELSEPLDLKGKVFHLAPSETTSGFHLRNDDNNLSKLKIVVDYDSRKEGDMDQAIRAIFELLHIQPANFQLRNTIRRPMTPDGRPLIEMNMGDHGNIHMVFGHNLYSIAPLYRTFAQNVAAAVNRSQPVFSPVPYNSELEKFGVAGRFKLKTIVSTRDLGIFADNSPSSTILPSKEVPAHRHEGSQPRAKL